MTNYGLDLSKMQTTVNDFMRLSNAFSMEILMQSIDLTNENEMDILVIARSIITASKIDISEDRAQQLAALLASAHEFNNTRHLKSGRA